MKKVKLRVAAKRPDGVTAEQWAALKAQPEMEVNFVTAIENVRLSKGAYEIVVPEEANNAPEMPEFNPETMSRGQLVAAAMQFGVTLSKPNVQTEDLRALVTKKYEAFMAAAAEPDES